MNKACTVWELLRVPQCCDLDLFLQMLWNRDVSGPYVIEQNEQGLTTITVRSGAKHIFDREGKRIGSN